MRQLTLLATTSAALALAALAAPQRGVVQAGDSPSYTFRESPFNGMGLRNLGELRGKPVLVEFWGTR